MTIKTNLTPWDSNATQFDVHARNGSAYEIDLSKLQFGVAANVAIAWRHVHRLIDNIAAELDRDTLHILDFGCGTGGFAEQRHQQGDFVSGIDSSPEMLKTARDKTSRAYIYYLTGNEGALRYFPRQDIVTANLVTNYLADLSPLAAGVASSLDINGHFLFADLNPHYVRECLRRGIIYSDPEPAENARFATLNFATGAKRITLWEPADYEAAFVKQGLELVSLHRPPLTPEFLKQFDSQLEERYPRDLPRYGIYHFRRCR